MHPYSLIKRVQRFDPSDPSTFPLAELLAASTLDEAQANALKVALTQEVALIQVGTSTSTSARLRWFWGSGWGLTY